MIVTLQESKLTDSANIEEIPKFTMFRQDRGRNKGGGLVVYVHESIPFTKLPSPVDDNTTETQLIEVGGIKIVNTYIPPVTSCPANYKPDFNNLFPAGEALVLGDFNAHDKLWNSSIEDDRGNDLAEFITESNYGSMNEEIPTRLPSYGQPTSPDISFATTSLLPMTTWTTHTSMGSDHLPIVIELSSSLHTIRSENRTYINFNKADWERFNNISEEQFNKQDPIINVHKAEKVFRKIINKTSKQCIPGGRIKDIIPEIPTDAARKIEIRNNLRNTNPESPEIARLNVEIYQSIKVHKKKKWQETIKDIGSTCSSKLFKLIKNITKPKTNNNQAIKFKGRYISNPNKIADNFNKQYSSVTRHTSSRDTRRVSKNIKKNSMEDAPVFTPEQTAKAIKKSKSSKAAGPDNITNLHLKHLGPKGLKFLTDIFNLTISTSITPSIWKNSVIIPLLKPGKDPGDSKSYRPVSLLCPAIKILERLLLPTLNEHLPIPEFQHGFRPSHSTITALNDFNTHVTTGFNQKRPPDRTILLQIDLSKAFDMVNHNKLLTDLNNTSLPEAVKRWFSCYLRGRQSRVNFRDKKSSSRNIHTGVPQGAVTSPILFNFYLTLLPRPPTGIYVIQYADDISIYTSGKDLEAMTNKINDYIKSVTDFLDERELMISPEKSTVTLFSPDPAQFNYHPQVKLKEQLVPLEKTPKLLGVTFDTMYTFSHHIKNSVQKAKTKLNILQCLTGTDWGQDKETLITTYKSIGRSVLEYGAPIWTPIICAENWTKLQTVQNKALKIATGCYKITKEDHLHQECKVLPVKDHCKMVTKQHLLNSYLPDHPGNKHLTLPRPPRKKKLSMYSYLPEVAEYSPLNNKKEVRLAMNKVHTISVRDSLNKLAVNRVLQTKPPEIHPSELQLERKTRTQLSQLRSGFSNLTNSYRCRCDNTNTISDICPECNQSPHDVNHLFNCTENPTILTPRDLWTQPILASEFLKLIDDGIT